MTYARHNIVIDALTDFASRFRVPDRCDAAAQSLPAQLLKPTQASGLLAWPFSAASGQAFVLSL
jgi:hypothetical protein